MISPNQSKDLFNLEQLRRDEYYDTVRQHLLHLGEDLTETKHPAMYAMNKLLNLLDGL